MSVPEPWPDADTKLNEDSSQQGNAGGRLHQPWRGWVALAEVVVASLLVVLAVWAWERGSVRIVLPAPNGATDTVTRLLGNWLASAIAAAAVAGFLVLDAIRQTVLAWRVRHEKPQ